MAISRLCDSSFWPQMLLDSSLHLPSKNETFLTATQFSTHVEAPSNTYSHVRGASRKILLNSGHTVRFPPLSGTPPTLTVRYLQSAKYIMTAHRKMLTGTLHVRRKCMTCYVTDDLRPTDFYPKCQIHDRTPKDAGTLHQSGGFG